MSFRDEIIAGIQKQLGGPKRDAEAALEAIIDAGADLDEIEEVVLPRLDVSVPLIGEALAIEHVDQETAYLAYNANSMQHVVLPGDLEVIEDIYDGAESVHLEEWPHARDVTRVEDLEAVFINNSFYVEKKGLHFELHDFQGSVFEIGDPVPDVEE